MIHFTPEDADLVARCVRDDQQAEDMCRDIIIAAVQDASSTVVGVHSDISPGATWESPREAWESVLTTTLRGVGDDLLAQLGQIYDEDPERVYAIRRLSCELHS